MIERIERLQRELSAIRAYHQGYLDRRDRTGITTKTDTIMAEHQRTLAEALDLLEAIKAERIESMTPEQEHIVKPHLELLQQNLPRQAGALSGALEAYLKDHTDPSGLKVSNLRLMADSLRRDADITDKLLEQLERKANPE